MSWYVRCGVNRWGRRAVEWIWSGFDVRAGRLVPFYSGVALRRWGVVLIVPGVETPGYLP